MVPPQPAVPPGATEPTSLALTVSQALALANTGVRDALGGPAWIRGEVAGLVCSQAGHLYWNLVDDRARLAVVAFRSDAARMRAMLEGAGVAFADGLAISVLGQLEVYTAKGQVQLRAAKLDPAVSVGEQALARRVVRKALTSAGLIEAQRSLVMDPVPLELVVVAPAGQGLGDLLGRLNESPWAWRLRVITAASEGPDAPLSIAAAVRAGGHCDVVILTRGGGAGATTAYDSDEVCRAVCSCPIPVMVAVGHTSDRSLADECAFATLPTPTAAAADLIARLEAADQALVSEARAAVNAAGVALSRARSDIEAEWRAIGATRSQLAGAIAARLEATEAHRHASRVRSRAGVALAVAVILILVLVILLIGAH